MEASMEAESIKSRIFLEAEFHGVKLVDCNVQDDEQADKCLNMIVTAKEGSPIICVIRKFESL